MKFNVALWVMFCITLRYVVQAISLMQALQSCKSSQGLWGANTMCYQPQINNYFAGCGPATCWQSADRHGARHVQQRDPGTAATDLLRALLLTLLNACIK